MWFMAFTSVTEHLGTETLSERLPLAFSGGKRCRTQSRPDSRRMVLETSGQALIFRGLQVSKLTDRCDVCPCARNQAKQILTEAKACNQQSADAS